MQSNYKHTYYASKKRELADLRANFVDLMGANDAEALLYEIETVPSKFLVDPKASKLKRKYAELVVSERQLAYELSSLSYQELRTASEESDSSSSNKRPKLSSAEFLHFITSTPRQELRRKQVRRDLLLKECEWLGERAMYIAEMLKQNEDPKFSYTTDYYKNNIKGIHTKRYNIWLYKSSSSSSGISLVTTSTELKCTSDFESVCSSLLPALHKFFVQHELYNKTQKWGVNELAEYNTNGTSIVRMDNLPSLPLFSLDGVTSGVPIPSHWGHDLLPDYNLDTVIDALRKLRAYLVQINNSLLIYTSTKVGTTIRGIDGFTLPVHLTKF